MRWNSTLKIKNTWYFVKGKVSLQSIRFFRIIAFEDGVYPFYRILCTGVKNAIYYFPLDLLHLISYNVYYKINSKKKIENNQESRTGCRRGGANSGFRPEGRNPKPKEVVL